jgi:hypothetical protein
MRNKLLILSIGIFVLGLSGTAWSQPGGSSARRVTMPFPPGHRSAKQAALAYAKYRFPNARVSVAREPMLDSNRGVGAIPRTQMKAFGVSIKNPGQGWQKLRKAVVVENSAGRWQGKEIAAVRYANEPKEKELSKFNHENTYAPTFHNSMIVRFPKNGYRLGAVRGVVQIANGSLPGAKHKHTSYLFRADDSVRPGPVPPMPPIRPLAVTSNSPGTPTTSIWPGPIRLNPKGSVTVLKGGHDWCGTPIPGRPMPRPSVPSQIKVNQEFMRFWAQAQGGAAQPQ